MPRVMKIINMKDTVILLLGKLTDYAMNVLMYSKKKGTNPVLQKCKK